MSKKENGGPAFPRPATIGNPEGAYIETVEQEGMALRDYFAGQALHTLSGFAVELYRTTKSGSDSMALLAVCAYELADQMIAERDK